MKIYVVNTGYIEYLMKYDLNVLENEKVNGGIRKYVGIVFQINNFNYFVPLSSPKPSDYLTINNIKKIRRSVVPIHRIIIKDGNNENFLGKLKFSSMIPVPNDELKLLDIDNIKDEKYKNVLKNQIRYIRKNKKILHKNHAEVIYNQKTKNINNIGYLNSTVNFALLEQKILEYELNKQKTSEIKGQVAATKETSK